MEDKNMGAVPQTAEGVTPEVTTEKTEEEIDWKSKALKAEELANNYKVRAEKAEKADKKAKNEPKDGDLSIKDGMLLVQSGIHADDIDEVVTQAKIRGMSISDALKADEVRAALYVRNEKRQTALATNINSKRKGTAQMSDDVLLERASRGELPDNVADISRLNKLKMAQLRPKRRQ